MRKRFLGLIVGLLALCLCGLKPSPALYGAGSELIEDQAGRGRKTFSPSSGETFSYAIASDADHLDLALTTSGDSFLVGSQIYDTLLKASYGESIAVPGLAESWSVSSDGLTWTFNIRPNVKFHDGTTLDAAAVLFNFQRWWDKANPYHQSGFNYFQNLFSGFKGEPSCLISDLKIIGNLQFQIVLSRPYSPLPVMLTQPSLSIASPSQIQAGALDAHPIGSGPFKFVDRIVGVRINLERSSSYWGQGPFVDHLVFEVIPGSTDRLNALQMDEIQVTPLDDDEIVDAGSDPGLKVYWGMSANTGYLGVNRARSPLNNPLVVQAIAHAVDKQSILSNDFNHTVEKALLAAQLLPSHFWGRDQTIADYSYNATHAKSLLSQAGYPDGFDTTLWVMPVSRFYMPDSLSVALSIQADLAAVGINAALVDQYGWSEYLSRIKNGEADLFQLGWGADFPHPDNFYYPMLCSSSFKRYGDRDNLLCSSLENAWNGTDFNALEAVYQAAGQRVHDTLPVIPIAHARSGIGLNQSIAGYQPTIMGFDDFENVFFVTKSVVVDIDSNGSIEGSDSQGNDLTIEIPTGAVDKETKFLFSTMNPQNPPTIHYPVSGFVVTVEQDGQPVDGVDFTTPLIVTIEYLEENLLGLDETGLSLFYWDGETWSTEGVHLIEHDTQLNRIQFSIDHLSKFVLAVLEKTLYLPVTLR